MLSVKRVKTLTQIRDTNRNCREISAGFCCLQKCFKKLLAYRVTRVKLIDTSRAKPQHMSQQIHSKNIQMSVEPYTQHASVVVGYVGLSIGSATP